MEKYESNENEQTEQLELPRKSPHLHVIMGGIACELTWYNTLVQLYMKPYQYLSHIEHRTFELYYDKDEPVEETLRIFSMGDCSILMGQQFPVRLDPEPSRAVAEEYIRRQQGRLDEDLKRLMSEDSEE